MPGLILKPPLPGQVNVLIDHCQRDEKVKRSDAEADCLKVAAVSLKPEHQKLVPLLNPATAIEVEKEFERTRKENEEAFRDRMRICSKGTMEKAGTSAGGQDAVSSEQFEGKFAKWAFEAQRFSESVADEGLIDDEILKGNYLVSVQQYLPLKKSNEEIFRFTTRRLGFTIQICLRFNNSTGEISSTSDTFLANLDKVVTESLRANVPFDFFIRYGVWPLLKKFIR